MSEPRKPVDILMDQVEWTPTGVVPPADYGLPHATHAGVLNLFGTEIRCYRLSDGRAILHADDMNAFFEAGLPDAPAWFAKIASGVRERANVFASGS